MFESDTKLCHNMRATQLTQTCFLIMETLTVISNYSGDLLETINKNNLALEGSSQLFPYITVERLKMYWTKICIFSVCFKDVFLCTIKFTFSFSFTFFVTVHRYLLHWLLALV